MSGAPALAVAPYADLQEQGHAALVGMWLFVASEALLFGTLFVAYADLRARYPDAFVEAAGRLHHGLGTANTAILLTSSLFAALAVHAGEAGRRRGAAAWLWSGAALGTLFLGLKLFEWSLEAGEHLVPGAGFAGHEFSDPRGAETFFGVYFVSTGLHALHVLVGVVLLVVLALRARSGWCVAPFGHRLLAGSLYWHLVDLVWVFLFPLLYLV